MFTADKVVLVKTFNDQVGLSLLHVMHVMKSLLFMIFLVGANNSPSQDSSHPDDHFQSRYVTPGLKQFSYS